LVFSRGVQKTITKSDPNNVNQYDPHSVQGLIEDSLRKFDPVNEILVKISSRYVFIITFCKNILIKIFHFSPPTLEQTQEFMHLNRQSMLICLKILVQD
jgi:hypothetical protein